MSDWDFDSDDEPKKPQPKEEDKPSSFNLNDKGTKELIIVVALVGALFLFKDEIMSMIRGMVPADPKTGPTLPEPLEDNKPLKLETAETEGSKRQRRRRRRRREESEKTYYGIANC